MDVCVIMCVYECVSQRSEQERANSPVANLETPPETTPLYRHLERCFPTLRSADPPHLICRMHVCEFRGFALQRDRLGVKEI